MCLHLPLRLTSEVAAADDRGGPPNRLRPDKAVCASVFLQLALPAVRRVVATSGGSNAPGIDIHSSVVSFVGAVIDYYHDVPVSLRKNGHFFQPFVLSRSGG